MSYTSNYNLNIRLSALEAQINGGGIPTSSTLADVLDNGNSAGSFNINLNNNDITNADQITCSQLNYTTLNPPVSGGSQTLAQTLVLGNSAGSSNINLNNNNITNVNNIGLTTINGSAYPPVVATPTLANVLLAGNSAGATDINLNNRSINNVLNIVGSTGVGQDLNISSTNNLTMSADNIDLGTTEIIYPTLATPARLRLKASGQVQVDNNGGGTTTPAIVLNQVATGGGILVEEVYNQRTATTGEFNRMSFFARSSTGAKTEYARIHQNAPVTTQGSTRGRLDFAVNFNGTMTDYLSINANTDLVSITNADLTLNGSNIVSVGQVSTPNNSTLAPQQVFFLTGNTSSLSGTKDPNQRVVYVNTGVNPTLQSAGSGGLGSWSPITASATYNGNTYVATTNGEIYYTNDPNSSWNSLGVQFNGQVSCFKEFNGDLYFGGNFTTDSNSSTTYNRIGRITNTPAITPITWANLGSVGFNANVNCFETEGSYLYVGGDFTSDGNNTSNLFYIAYVDSGNNVYNTNNNSTDGFNGSVTTICNDTGSNRFIIGGTFNTFNTGGSGFFTPYYLQIDFTGGYIASSFFVLSPSLNGAPTSSVKDTNTGAIILGGNFTSISPYTDYIFEMFWNGTSYQPQNFSYTAPTSPPPFLIRSSGTSAIYWAQSNVLYSSSGWSITSPVGGTFTTAVYTAWGQDNFSTNSGAQNPIVLYFRNTSNSINISLLDPVRTQGGGYFTNTINLANNGNSCELIWFGGSALWYLISNEGATFT